MSEAPGRADLQDESFRQRLIEDPKGAVEQELGSGCPRGFGLWQ
jgi:hypothetical protein